MLTQALAELGLEMVGALTALSSVIIAMCDGVDAPVAGGPPDTPPDTPSAAEALDALDALAALDSLAALAPLLKPGN